MLEKNKVYFILIYAISHMIGLIMTQYVKMNDKLYTTAVILLARFIQRVSLYYLMWSFTK